MTFQIGMFKFIDSLLFLKESLKTLVNDLRDKDKNSFTILKKSSLCKTNDVFDPRKFDLLLGKLAFCYDYLTRETMKEGLPVQEKFYNNLTSTHITSQEYSLVKEIFKLFECTTLGDLLKIYVKLDVILLGEIII